MLWRAGPALADADTASPRQLSSLRDLVRPRFARAALAPRVSTSLGTARPSAGRAQSWAGNSSTRIMASLFVLTMGVVIHGLGRSTHPVGNVVACCMQSVAGPRHEMQ
eukprot:5815361-Pyramimonas_sp.AAC.1